MKKSVFLFSLIILLSVNAFAQWSREERERINRENQTDHQLMMKLLNIKELRPGPSGKPDGPNAANTDESKATPYTSLPDPLIFEDGTPVITVDQWNKRKLEILESFDREIYGRVPAETPSIKWEVINEKDTVNGEYPINTKELIGNVDNSAYPEIEVRIQMTLSVPRQVTSPVPVIMEFGWNFPMSSKRQQPEAPTWQQQLLEKGWGYAILVPKEIALIDGEIAFRQHAGGHTVGPNWPVFIKYAEGYFSR